jgi:hypothetical protein
MIRRFFQLLIEKLKRFARRRLTNSKTGHKLRMYLRQCAYTSHLLSEVNTMDAGSTSGLPGILRLSDPGVRFAFIW